MKEKLAEKKYYPKFLPSFPLVRAAPTMRTTQPPKKRTFQNCALGPQTLYFCRVCLSLGVAQRRCVFRRVEAFSILGSESAEFGLSLGLNLWSWLWSQVCSGLGSSFWSDIVPTQFQDANIECAYLSAQEMTFFPEISCCTSFWGLRPTDLAGVFVWPQHCGHARLLENRFWASGLK